MSTLSLSAEGQLPARAAVHCRASRRLTVFNSWILTDLLLLLECPHRLHPDLDKHAVVSDEAGLLHHVLLHGSHFTTDSVYQLQYGTELLYQGTEVSEVPCMIERQWSSFQFVPNRTGGILFHQSGSTKLLYTILPDAKTVSSPVLLFGSHTGQQLCFPHRPDSLLGTYAVLTTCWLRSLQAAGNSVTSF